MTKCYSELIKLDSFIDRLNYLKLNGKVGDATFGSHRYLNQMLYKTPRWKSLKNDIIIRDNSCDLAHCDFEIRMQPVYIHHINPITIEDILNENPMVYDPENLITTVFKTHQAIHYGDISVLTSYPTTRAQNDTCPWKQGGEAIGR